jgi:hypothetical protein
MCAIIDIVLVANGLYDLTCACSILWLHKLPVFSFLSNLHSAMFKHEHPVVRRLLAYWLITYGTVRAAAGLHRDLRVLAASTYFIEAFCFEHESWVGETMVRSKVTFVSVFSVLLGVLVLTQPDM